MHQHNAAVPSCKSMANFDKDPVQPLSRALQRPQHYVVWRGSLKHMDAHLHDVQRICNTGGACTAMQAACMRSSAHMTEDSQGS